MRIRGAMPRSCVAAAVVCLLLCTCAHRDDERPSKKAREQEQVDLEQLKDEFQQILEKRLEEQRAGGRRPLTGAEALADLRRTGRAMMGDIRKLIRAELVNVVEREFGPQRALQVDRILLQAMDKKGRVIEIPMDVETRPLRYLADPANAPKTQTVLAPDSFALALYEDLPRPIAPKESKVFRRIYTGDAADAIGMEAKLLVTLKGGEWAEPEGEERAANAVAVRGLDLDRGLLDNGNKTYDDTMYIIVEQSGGESEVYEYRMTTESSSEKEGVGRLDSKQVKYVRGLHRGKDPAYRLKGNQAEGTRLGRKGKHKIVGANMHSAYTKRTITSETPLSPNVSLGCQVVAASKSAFEESLVSFLDKKGVNEFLYTIIDGEELAVLDRALLQNKRWSVLMHGVARAKMAEGSGKETL